MRFLTSAGDAPPPVLYEYATTTRVLLGCVMVWWCDGVVVGVVVGLCGKIG